MYALTLTDRKIISSFTFALVFNAIVLHWSSTFVGALPWQILAAGLSIFYTPLALVSKWGIASYPFIFVVLEELRNRFPFGGFGWARIAYTQADSPFAQIAAVGGATALSASVLLIGLFIYSLSQKKVAIFALLPLFAIFVPVSLQTVGSTNVLMIQGNVPELGLDFNSRARAVFYNHYNETVAALKTAQDVDFILWPENAVDVDPFRDPQVFKALNTVKKPLIIGAIVYKGEKMYNTSILWGKELPPIYFKQHLTPFGEYIPLRSLASRISPLTDKVRDFEAGQDSVFFTVKSAVIAPVICFELIDDQLLVTAANNSNILAVQTNSATFGTSAESAQQLEITRVRAIEHGRNIVSVSTTGYSAIIDSNGDVSQKSSMGRSAAIQADVALIEGKTPRDRAGDWALVAVLLALLAVSRRSYI